VLAFKGKYMDYIISAAQHFNTDMGFLWFLLIIRVRKRKSVNSVFET